MDSYGVDTTFELNDFGNPRLRSEDEMIKNILLTILFMKPGQYASLPVLGLDIKNLLYSNYDELDTDELENQLIEQCEALSTPIYNGDIQIKKVIYRGMHSLIINVITESDDSMFRNASESGAVKNSSGFYIGISVNELNELLYNVSSKTS